MCGCGGGRYRGNRERRRCGGGGVRAGVRPRVRAGVRPRVHDRTYTSDLLLIKSRFNEICQLIKIHVAVPLFSYFIQSTIK